MMNKTRREMFLFSASDIKATEEHFEKMASKGWILEEVNQYSAKYKRTEPQELKFYLDIFPYFSALDSPTAEDISEYRDLCIDAGWEFVASSNKLQVFYSIKSDNLPPIQSDERIEQAVINKSVYLDMISWISVLPIYILSLWNLFSFDYEKLYYNMSIIYLIFPIVIIPLLIHICSQVLWLINARKAIAKGESLPRTSYKLLRFKTVLLLSTVIVLCAAMGLAILLDLFSGNYIILVGLVPILFGIIFITVYGKTIKNSKKRSKWFKVSSLIVFTIAIIIGINLAIFSILGSLSGNRANDLREGYLGLRLTDFDLGIPSHSSFSRSGSILIPKSSSYYEITRENDIKTEYAKAINNKMAQYIFASILKENHNRFQGGISSATEEYKDFDDSIYLDEGKNRLLLLKDKFVFMIESNLDLSIEENKDIITNRLLNQ